MSNLVWENDPLGVEVAQEEKPLVWESDPQAIPDKNIHSLVPTAYNLNQGKNDMSEVVELSKQNNVSYDYADTDLAGLKMAVSHERTVPFMQEQSKLADKYFPKTKQFMAGEGAAFVASQFKDMEKDTWYERPFTEIGLASDMGSLALELNRINNRQFWGIASDDEVKSIPELQEKLSTYSQLREDENFFTGTWREMFATFVPQMGGLALKSAQRATEGAAAGAVVGGLAGTIAPGIGNVTGVATGAATGMATGAKFGAAEYSFGQALGEVYGSLSQMKDSNGNTISPDAARAISVISAGAMAGLEMFGLGKMLDLIPGMDNMLTGKALKEATEYVQSTPAIAQALGETGIKMLTALSAEVGTEVLQEGVGVLAEQSLRAYSKSEGDTTPYMSGAEAEERLLNAGEMALKGVFIPTALGGMGRGVYTYREIQNAQAQAKIEREGLQNIAKGVQGTDLAEKAPQVLQEVLKQTTGGASTFIEPQALQALFQDAEGQAIAARAGITPDMVADAIEMQVDVAIPIHKQAELMRSQYWQSIEPFSKLTPTSPNQDQAQALLSEDLELVNEAMQDNGFLSFMDEVDAEYTRREQWKDTSSEYVYQLEEAGYTPLQAENMGMVLGAHAEIFAPLYNQTPKEFLTQRLKGFSHVTPTQFKDVSRRFMMGDNVDLIAEREASDVAKMQKATLSPVVESITGMVDADSFKKTFGNDAYKAVVKRYGRKFFATKDKVTGQGGLPLDSALSDAYNTGLISSTTNPDEVAEFLAGNTAARQGLFQGDGTQRTYIDEWDFKTEDGREVLFHSSSDGLSIDLNKTGSETGATALYFGNSPSQVRDYGDGVIYALPVKSFSEDGFLFENRDADEDVLKSIIEEMGYDYDSNEDVFWNTIVEENNNDIVNEDGDTWIELLADTLGKSRSWADDGGWWAQNVRIELARRQGFKAVAMDDEVGSIAVLREHLQGLRKLQEDEEGNLFIENQGTFSAESDNIYYQGRPQATPETARGVIMRRDTDHAFMIGLFKGKKDISTIVHEGAGHFFLENLREAAALPDAPEWVTKAWTDVANGIGANVDPTQKIEMAAHEKYARMAVEYFRQGKAPSSELQGVFRMFGRWLANIYRQIKRVLTDFEDIPKEVQDAMDRLIATEADIEKAGATFEEQTAPEGIELSKWQQYQKLLAKAKKDAEAALALRRLGEEMRIEKEAKLEARILMPSDKEMAEVLRVKNAGGLSFDELMEVYGEESTYTLYDKWNRSQGKQLIKKSNAGATIDEVLEMMGFDDSVQLLSWLLTAKTEKEYTDGVVDARLKEWEESYSPTSEAVGMDSSDRALAARDEALTGQVQVSTEALTKALQDRVEAMPLDSVDAEYGSLRASEERVNAARGLAREIVSQQEAIKTRKDVSTDKKIQALKDSYNERLARQKEKAESKLNERIGVERKRRAALATAYRTRIERDQIISKVRKISASKSINDAYHQQILGLVSRFGGLGTPSMKAREGTAKLADFWQAWALDEGMEKLAVPQLPEWLLALADRKFIRFNELTIEQMRDVHNLVKQLRHMGNHVDKLIGMMQQATIDETVEKLTESILTLPKRHHIDEIERDTTIGNIRHWLRKSHADKTLMRYVFMTLDGSVSKGSNTAMGSNQEILLNQLLDAQDTKMTLAREYATKTREILTEALDGVDIYKPFEIKGVVLSEDVAREWRNMWTMEKVFTLALNMGNAGNIKAIQKGYGLDDQSLALILDRMTPKMWDAVQNVWNMLEELYPKLNETHNQLYGINLPKVKIEPLEVGGKTLAGGYYPLMFDRRFSNKAAEQQDIDNILNGNEAIMRTPNPKSGMTKERKGGTLPPRLALDVLSQHIQDTVHYSTHAVPLRNVYKLMTDQRYQRAFEDVMGVEMYAEVLPWLRGIARTEPRLESFGSKGVDWLAKRGTLFTLGFSVRTALMGFTSISNSMQRVGVGNFMGALAKIAARPRDMWGMVGDLSPYMRERSTLYDRDVRATINTMFDKDTLINVGGFKVNRAKFEAAAFAMIAAVDAVVARPTWLAMYEKALNEGKRTKEAQRLADNAVFEAQAGGSTIDTSKLMRNPGGMRLLTVFMTFASNQYNRNAYMWRAWMNNRATNGQASNVTFADFALYVAMTTLVPSLAVTWMIGYGGSGEEPEAKDVVWEMISMLTGGMPWVRLGVSALRFDSMSVAGFRGFDLAGDAVRTSVQLMEGTKSGRDNEYKAFKALINAAGFAAGVPTAQVFKTLEGIEAYEKGNAGVLAPVLGKPYKPKGQESLFN